MIDDKEKEDIKLRFAICLQKVIEDNEMTLRGLAASSGLEYTNVQRASVGEVNIALTTIIALAEGLNITPSKLFQYYEKVSQNEINDFKEGRKKKKKK
jgi:transcriptional regulator with XRE-family HTH domain